MTHEPPHVPAAGAGKAAPLRPELRIPGYSATEEIYRGRKRVVYRALRESDRQPVILKTLVDDHADAAGAAALRREFEILRGLAVDGVVRAHDLVRHRDRAALVLEDIGGQRLKTLIGKGMEIPVFLELAERLAVVVAAVHRHGILHKDLNPNNILVQQATGELRLIDFSIASRLPLERQPLGHPSVLEGTLAYMSPEQTGRMNRAVDYRTDFYSLGVTFYEMLTGRLPFDSVDPLEVVHGHIARTAPAPHELDPRVPAPLSAIVMRLLAKTPEARYQSGLGLAADLARCREEWQATGTIAQVVVGEQDFSDRFVIPQQLYGRDPEIAALLESFAAAATGKAGLMLVSGYSGIGKTSLIHELHKSLTGRRGYFVSGKFDQLVRNVPYGAVAQAFDALARQLLNESDVAVQAWKEALLGALGSSAQVILDVIPALERIIGPQPPVPALGATEAQNRFNLLFQHLLGAFAAPQHPLVLFFDDLQWADAASLKLLETLFANSELRGLLVIGAYRDNEVTEKHPLLLTVAGIRNAGSTVHEMTLSPLDPAHLNQFIADTLRGDAERAQPLSELVLQKTDGNPFFVTQFLNTLHQEGLLAFDYGSHHWDFDLDGIRSIGITDNVVDLMAARIRRLQPRTQEVLKLAACIGNRFDLGTLATINGKNTAATAGELWEAVERGLVLPLGDAGGPAAAESAAAGLQYRFLHDRVQQAAYALIPEAAQRQVHLTVGRLLLSGLTAAELEERIFDVVNQLDRGADLITDPDERLRVAELNFAAARKAKASTAYPAALNYFRAAAALLDDAAWSTRYAFAFPLHLGLAECEYLCGQFADAEQTFARLRDHARTAVDAGEVHCLRIVQYENLSRYADAIAAAREGVALFGIQVPEAAAEKATALAAEIDTITAGVGNRPIAALADLPVMTDAAVKMCMRLLMTAWASAYIAADTDLMEWMAAKMVSLSLANGNTEESASGYVMHGITVGSRLGDYAAGHEFGKLALQVNEKFDDLKSRAKVYELFGCFVQLWREPLRACMVHTQRSYRSGLESGDFTYATYAIFVESWYALLTSRELVAFQKEYGPVVGFLRQIQYHSFAETQQLILNWGAALQGATRGRTSMSGNGFDARAFRKKNASVPFFQVFYWVPRLHLLFTMERYRAAAVAAHVGEQVIGSLTGTIWPALLAFYQALTLAALQPRRSAPRRQQDRVKLGALESRLRVWAENCPQTFRHRHLLVAAEVAGVDGRSDEAMRLYEAAIQAAAKSDFRHDRALANELYAKFWLRRGQEKVAAVFMTAAHSAYAEWGAAAKARDLVRRYAALIQRPAAVAEVAAASLGTAAAPPALLDYASVMKAAQVIAGEIDLERLLVTLMHILLENAGAQRGLLVLDVDGRPLVQAEGAVGGGTHVLQATPLEARTDLCVALVNYARRTGETVVLSDAAADPVYAGDPYVARQRPRSILCSPILHQGRIAGVVYLENNLAAGAFPPERGQLVQMLSAPAAIAIRNAELFAEVNRLRDRLQAENVYLHEEIKTQHGFEEIVGRSAALRRVLQQVEQVAPTDTTVLLCGETGTGKELLARALHNLSGRSGGPLVTVNCGAISGGLIESELFGHEKGAFTGALARKIGRFELADGGTVFLDEIGDLPVDLQVKLLRVLQEGEFERVGGTKTLRVDVRVVAATHRNLEQSVRDGNFRQDLFYRLNVFPITTPPLRDRREDIPLLVRYFAMQFGVKMGKRIEVIPRRTLDALVAYAWPGNIRELRNVIERAVIISTGDALELGDWFAPLQEAARAAAARTLQDVERDHILEVLEQTRWRVSGKRGAAELLGLKPTTLEARMKKLGIRRTPPGARPSP